MDGFLSPAVIAAFTSLAISLLTLFQFFRNQRFQQEQFDKLHNRNFTTKLYDLRLDHYPRAFDILDTIKKGKGGFYDIGVVKSAHADLVDWKKGTVNLIISNEALISFNALRDCIGRNPATIDNFSPEQTKKISEGSRDFRRQLRRDLGFMFREEKQRRNAG